MILAYIVAIKGGVMMDLIKFNIPVTLLSYVHAQSPKDDLQCGWHSSIEDGAHDIGQIHVFNPLVLQICVRYHDCPSGL
jgi:hypothetical protein